MHVSPRLIRSMALAMLIISLFAPRLEGSLLFPVDTAESPFQEQILYIGHFDFDCVEDTVLGAPDGNQQYRLHAIGWGTRNQQAMHCPGDSTPSHHSQLHSAAAVSRTKIGYPAWSEFHTSAAFQDINGDTLTDIIFFLRGKVPAGTGERDTARVIVLFGQKWLDTVAMVPLGSIGSFQYQGFFALDLRYGRDIVEPDVRDLSGTLSYVLLPVMLNVLPDSSITPQSPHGTGPTLEVRVHPNPAIEMAQIEGRSIPSGEYTVEIIAVNGEVQHKQDVTVTTSGELLRTLDLRSLASGYYLVRLHQRGDLRATYPIIITR